MLMEAWRGRSRWIAAGRDQRPSPAQRRGTSSIKIKKDAGDAWLRQT